MFAHHPSIIAKEAASSSSTVSQVPETEISHKDSCLGLILDK
jgi:hypothetical protein